jgi:hypothetical protein
MVLAFAIYAVARFEVVHPWVVGLWDMEIDVVWVQYRSYRMDAWVQEVKTLDA